MKCSRKDICLYPCGGKIPKQYEKLLISGAQKGLKDDKVPSALIDKVTHLITEELDAYDFCRWTRAYIGKELVPKQRILDRSIVHMFELFYSSVIEKSEHGSKFKEISPDFFCVVPRGDCLDSFLKIVKEQCLGPEEIDAKTAQLASLVKDYCQAGIVDWASVYSSPEFKVYLNQLIETIFAPMNKGRSPIPALNNQMLASQYPGRINLLLKHMLKIWQANNHTNPTK